MTDMTKQTEAISTERALKLALEALESCDAAHITDGGRQWYDEKLVDKAVEAIEKALTSVPDWASEAKEQPAPVAKPRKQEPLTDEQYFEIGQRHWLPSIKVEKIHKEIIEAAHGITKGGAA